MAGFLTKIGRIVNPFDEHTLKTSIENRGGYLGKGSSTDPNTYLPSLGVLGSANVVNPSPAENTIRQMGTVLSGNNSAASPLPTAADSQIAANQQSQPPGSTPGGRVAGGTGGGAGLGRQSLGYFMGKEYYDAAELYNDQLAYLDNVYGTNLATLRRGKQQQLDEYGRQKTNLGQQLTDVLSGYDKQETQGLGSIASYYGNLGDIYQSSQGTREAGFKGEVENARGQARKQAQEGTSALERAIADYLYNYDQTERDLATQYGGARDDIANTVVGDLASRLEVRNALGQGVATDLTPLEIGTNNSLINRLQGIQRGQLNRFNQGTTGSINPILAYLQGLPLGA